jgi:acetyl esterase/lipase
MTSANALRLFYVFSFCLNTYGADPLELRLWPGKAPGTENWTVPESIAGRGGNRVATNVSDPTLTVYLPDAERANGAAIIVAPGGALQALTLDAEGSRVAEWLNSKGIAAFVLKYRLRQQQPVGGGAGRGGRGGPGRSGPGGAAREEITIIKGNANPAPHDAALTEVLRMAVADAQQALRLIRKNTGEWHVDPNRIGMMGFSAGGGVSVGTALANEPGAKVNFLISVYGPSLQDVIVPDDAPPLFVAVGAQHFNVTSGCLALFAEWKKAGKPAEIHVYDQTSGGFAMSKRGVPVDTWPDRLLDWMQLHRLLNPQ